ncbi:hypothetical protein D3C78_1352800 [compost metagenome]
MLQGDSRIYVAQMSKQQNCEPQMFDVPEVVGVRGRLLVQNYELKKRKDNGNHPNQQNRKDVYRMCKDRLIPVF